MATLDVGLLGCGPWGQLILRDLLQLGARVHVWTPGDESAAAARNGGAATVTQSLDLLPEVDGLVVATTTASHADVIDAVAHRGVPIFVEKPLCADAATARRLARELEGRLFVMDKWRYHNGVLALAGLAASGELGTVVGVTTTRIGWATNHPDVDAAWILLPHDLSIALEIFGDVSPVTSVVGHVDNDGMVREMRGVCAKGSGPWHAFHVADRSPIERREVTVSGTEASATMTGGYADRILVRGAMGARDVAFASNMPLLDELAAFVEHLRGGPAVRSSATEAARAVEVIDAARSALGARSVGG
jgi:predicted dehydrogenase